MEILFINKRMIFSFIIFSIYISFSHTASEVKFDVKPQNGTFVSGMNFTLYCAVDASFTAGLEWQLYPIPWREPIRIGESIEGTPEYIAAPPGFHVNRPNNFTSELTVLNPNASFVGNYCCQYRNAYGPMWCAYVTEYNGSQLPYSYTTKADEATATASTTTVNLSTSDNGLSTGVIVIIVIAVVLLIALIIGVVIWIWKRHEKCRGSRSEGTPAEKRNMAR